MFLYLIRNRNNGKVYIGKTKETIERRWDRHLGSVRRGSKLPIHSAIRLYGPHNFERWCLSEYTNSDDLANAEITAIKRHQSLCPNGYNVSRGGDGGCGRHSEETKFKLSQALKGRVISLEWRKKLSDAHRGKPWSPARRAILVSPETKEKMSRAHKGYKASDKTRQKIREQNLGKKRKPLSKEHRQKLSVALKGRKLPPRSPEHCRNISKAKKRKLQ